MDFKKFLPHIYVLTGFFVAILIYFLPLFQGKSIRSHDIVQYQGMAKEITDNRTKYGEEPLWTGAMFSGMPNTLINMDQYGNLIKPIHDLSTRIIAYPASIIFMCLVCYYILLLAFDVHFILAALGAIGFTFASFNFIGLIAGHNAKLACVSYMPLVIAGMVYAYRKNMLLGAGIFGIGIALQITNNHVQITYYLAIIGLAYAAIELINAVQNKALPHFFKASAGLAIAAIIGLGTHAGYFMSINEYSKYTIRGKTELTPTAESKEAVRADGLDRDYVFQYSYSINEPMTFLIPDYYGGASNGAPDKFKNTVKAMRENGVDQEQAMGFINQLPAYFGEQTYVAGPFYMGAVICFLFLFGMIVLEDKIKWGLLACTVIGILLTYGRNFPALNYFLFDHFPLYNKFRSVTMAEIIPQFCMSLVGVLGIQKMINTKDKTAFLKPLYIAGGVTAGIAALVFLMAGSANYLTEQEISMKLPDWLLGAVEEDRKNIRTSDALRTIFFILAACLSIYLLAKQKINHTIAALILTILTLSDLWLVDKRYLNGNNFEKKLIQNFYTPTEADQLILQDQDPNFRVINLNNPFSESRTSYFHKSVGGYSPAKLRRYQDLIERKISSELQFFIDGLNKQEMRFDQLPVLNMLNTKYLIAGEGANTVIPNKMAMGNAWFVSGLKLANSPDEEMAILGTVSPKTTAIIDGSRFKTEANTFVLDSNATVRLTAYKPYDLTYESNNPNNGFAVFSEVYYPKGWIATIDGKETDLKCVNYCLRGLEIPAGKHIINFKFTNVAYQTGNTIGLICSALLYLGLAGVIYTQVRKKNSES